PVNAGGRSCSSWGVLARVGTRSDPETLPFVVAVDPDDGQSKGVFGRPAATVAVRQVPVSAFQENLRKLVTALQEVLDEIAAEPGRLPLKEAQVSFQGTASGSVQLLGVGGEVGGTGGITFTFGR